jgi:hypothetical protein
LARARSPAPTDTPPTHTLQVPASLARVARYRDAVLSRPSVKATMQPPEGGSYFEQMANTYRTYIDNRRKAAAAAAST